MNKPYLVVYVTDNHDLYWEAFKTEKAALKFINTDIEEMKALLILAGPESAVLEDFS